MMPSFFFIYNTVSYVKLGIATQILQFHGINYYSLSWINLRPSGITATLQVQDLSVIFASIRWNYIVYLDVGCLMFIFVYSLPEAGCSGFKHLSSGTADFGIQKFSL